MKTKIDFQKLIDGYYALKTELLVFQWLLVIGQECDEWTGKWNRVGVHQKMFDYSYNNEPFEYIDLGCNYREKIRLGFFYLLSTTTCKPIKQWKERHNILLGKYRMLDINFIEENYNIRKGLGSNLIKLSDYNNAKIKDGILHTDFPSRKNPYIKGIVKFSTNGINWQVWFDFTFPQYPDSGWTHSIQQEENETIDSFFVRANQEIAGMIK